MFAGDIAKGDTEVAVFAAADDGHFAGDVEIAALAGGGEHDHDDLHRMCLTNGMWIKEEG